MIRTNDTGCVVTVSDITGDVLCRWPGADCDCLMSREDDRYAEYAPCDGCDATMLEPCRPGCTAAAATLEGVAS